MEEEGPVVLQHQLLGDAYMVQLAEFLGWQLEGVDPARIGLCVSDQTVVELRRTVDDHGYFSRPVIVLIGSHELFNDGEYRALRGSFHRLIMKLRMLAPSVTFLTPPPAPAKWGETIYKRHLMALRRWLMRYERWGVRVIDTTTPFIRNGGVDDSFFEKWMGKESRRRPDGINLNDRGMSVLLECLERNIW
ncbi:uncharacterized protein LOC124172909 [Ischnura elegans]|uniref:uncharacterized protein LOC124172909 n=1 Tax=Ischnura elegans TaxID=197161 RepID=UPI001ED87027|nr:uncharacterized protein LOC124172909 [Ischnura elegans]